MKTLSLIIKREFFDKILSGEKTIEFREIRPTTASRYIYYINNDNGQIVAPKDIKDAPDTPGGYSYEPIKYDAIRLFVGYNKNRASAVVEVKDAQIYEITDENNEVIIYEHEGQEYPLSEIRYTLGKVLEKENC